MELDKAELTKRAQPTYLVQHLQSILELVFSEVLNTAFEVLILGHLLVSRRVVVERIVVESSSSRRVDELLTAT